MDFSKKMTKILGVHSTTKNGQKFLAPTLNGPMGAEISERQNFCEPIWGAKLVKNASNSKNMGARGGLHGVAKIFRPHTFVA